MIIIIILLFASFSRQRELIVFHWSQHERKSPQVPGTLFSILTDLNYAIVWMFSTRPLNPNSSSPFAKPITFGSQNIPKCFSSLARVNYMFFF